MRTEFINELTRLAEEDERVCLVVGDLGFGVVQDFARRFPDRFLNAGIAEQSMTGVAAGWALSGKVVFTYSIANFPTLRCLEQIRNDACDHRANVKVAAVGGGFAYGALGASHHATEDLAILRALPGIAVVAPGDTVEARLATRAVVDEPGPCYLRLGRAGEPTVHAAEPGFRIGRAITVRDGDDLTLISTGGMLKATAEAADLLAAEGFAARVLSMHTLRPLDDEAVERAAVETGALVTVEEHSVIGGLGGAVAEVLAEQGAGARLRRLGVPVGLGGRVGGQEYMLRRCGLTAAGIAAAARDLVAPARRGRRLAVVG